MFLILFLYSLSFGLLLVNHGVYWDDWATIVGRSSDFIQNAVGVQMGNPIGAYILNWVNGFHSYTLYRLITFLAYGLCGFFVYSILKRVKEIDAEARYLITLFFLIYPANDARVVLVIVVYTLAHFFFYLGWWLVSVNLQNKNILCRLLSLASLFISFSVNSFLFYYLFVLLYIVYFDRKKFRTFTDVTRYLFRYGDFLILPVIFYVWKMYFLIPLGIYEGYNKIVPTHVVKALLYSFTAYWSSFIVVIISSLYSLLNVSLVDTFIRAHGFLWPIVNISWSQLWKNNSLFNLLVLSCEISLLYILLRKNIRKYTLHTSLKTTISMFIMGCIGLYFAVFPYFVVGKTPSIFGAFSDRHLLLVSLGASFMIVYGIRLFCTLCSLPRWSLIFLYSLLTVMFVQYHAVIQIDYLKDWYKQRSLISQMKVNRYISDNNSFLIIDNANELNILHRPFYSFYEYSGIMKFAYGDGSRFASSPYEKFSISNFVNNQIAMDLYNLSGYQQKAPQYIITIDSGKYILSNKNLFRLMFNEYINKAIFERDVNTIITITAKPIVPQKD